MEPRVRLEHLHPMLLDDDPGLLNPRDSPLRHVELHLRHGMKVADVPQLDSEFLPFLDVVLALAEVTTSSLPRGGTMISRR